MKTFLTTLVVMVLSLGTLFSQNILEIPSVQALQGDTLTIPVEFINQEEFVAFQIDLSFPEGIDFIPQSAFINPDRSGGHLLPYSIIKGGKLRVLSFAIPTTTFSGNSGPIFSFKVGISASDGDYVIEISNPIFVSTQATGLNFGVINGVISVGEVEETQAPKPIKYVLQAEKQVTTITEKGEDVVQTLEVESSPRNYKLLILGVILVIAGILLLIYTVGYEQKN